MAAVLQSPSVLSSHSRGEKDDGPSASGRKRSPTSRSPSPKRRAPKLRQPSRSRSPAPRRDAPLPRDVDRGRAVERQRQLDARAEAEDSKPLSAEEKQAAAKKEYERLLTMRSGGTYIPPARLRALQAEIGNDPQSKEFQRMAWEALKKSINGLINKVNVSNIKHIVPELFGENLMRGRGLFCRSIMKAQAASLPFTSIYAAMAAVVNTKLPQIGELLVNRLIIQFRKAYKRNDKNVCLSSTTFLAHLINQQVASEMLAAQILLLLLNKPTDDSVEIAVGLMKEVGQHLEEFQPKISMAVYDQFRNILHEADIDKRVQYMIEVLFQIRKSKYEKYPAVKEELDLVEEEDQITHNPGLDEQVDVEDGLNIFKFDPAYEENEAAYKKLKAEILGEADDSEEEDDDDGSDKSSEDEVEVQKERELEIKDQSNTDLVNLRRTIYLTIMSSGGFEECTHKLLRINLPPGFEHELPSMLIECSSQERTYNKFYGLIGERLCKINRSWMDQFEDQFIKYYETIHRLETNKLRIVAQLFGQLFASNAIGWHVLSVVHLNEEETTSSSRIFIKILFEELASGLGMKTLAERMKDDLLQPSFAGLYPTDNPRNTRFSINFFTAIGMGALTEGMREFLKNMPQPAAPALPAPPSPSSSRSRSASSYSSYSSRSRSRSVSRSRSPVRRNGRSLSKSRSPPARKARARSYSDSRSRTPSRRRTPVRRRRNSPSRSRSRSRSPSQSRSPPRRHCERSDSRSPSPRRRQRGRSASYSRSRSPLPRRRGRSVAYSTSPSRRSISSSRSRSRSPPPRRRAAARDRSTSDRSRSRSRSYSRSRSPPRRGHKSAGTASRAVPRGQSRDRSRPRSPPPKPAAKPVHHRAEVEAIHPSRRGLVDGGGPSTGGRGGRGGFRGGRAGRDRPTSDRFL